MKTSAKFLAALFVGVGALGVAAASAHEDERRGDRGEICSIDHDHRSHDAHYYDHHPKDKYSRVGDRRGDDRGRNARYEYGYGERYRDSRPVHREIYDTRYRARLVLTEEVVRTRQGPRLVCTVSARGPEAGLVPYRHLKRVARNECSRRSRIVIDA